MLKKILTVLDTSKASQHVRDLSICIAKNTNAKITGVAILDLPTIVTPYSEPLGGIAYNVDHEEELISQSRYHVLELVKKFKDRARSFNLDINTIEVEGDPIQEIENISHEHNLIIISRKTNFHFEDGFESDETVKKVTRDNPRPIIIVPPYNHNVSIDDICNDKNQNIAEIYKAVLVVYNGSLASSRSLHMFLLLNFSKNYDMHILSISDNKDQAIENANQASRICGIFGIKAELHTVKSKKNATQIVNDKSKEIKAWMIVLGAPKNNQIQDTLFPSLTSNLMKESIVPLFI